MSSLSLRHHLRAETSQAHAALDRLWTGHDLSRRAGYVGFLRAIAGALLPIEAALTAAGAAALLPDWPNRRRAAALLADLSGVGQGSPLWPAMRALSSPALWGALYVLEGSRLGANVLLRQLDPADPTLHKNRRFLAHGAGERYWPTFADRLDRVDPSPAVRTAIVDCALETFARFTAAAAREAAPGLTPDLAGATRLG